MFDLHSTFIIVYNRLHTMLIWIPTDTRVSVRPVMCVALDNGNS